jgi:outer membrane receptor protein involved in Fe transport
VAGDVVLTPSQAPTGSLVVRANVAGALIRVDGRESGFAPAVIDGVPTGARDIEIVADGRQPFRQTAQVSKGERIFIDAHLGKLDLEVTAATKSTVGTESAPASVSVLGADTIAALGYTSLAEAVAAIRGTFTSNDRTYESVGFFGFSPPGDYTKRVLVMVDGHPLNDAVTGQGYVGHDFDVDLANVARIEIVRGPGSVLYGTGALFGVINVVTRQAAEGAHASANVTAGSMGLLSGRVTTSARDGNTSLMVSVAGLRSDGEHRFVWPAEPGTGASTTVIDADGERARHVDVTGRLGPLSLRAGYGERSKDLPNGAFGILPEPGSSIRDRRGFAELRFEQALHEITVAARAAYDMSRYRGRYRFADVTSAEEQNLSADWLTGEVRIHLPRLLLQRLTVGAEIVQQLGLVADTADSTTPKIPRDRVLSAYVVDDARLGSRLSLNLGVRMDSYTKSFGTTLNPRFAVIARPYQGGNTKLFFGGAFRAPSPGERVDSPVEALRPETIWSGELEHTHSIGDDVKVVGAVFANWMNHFITLRDDPVWQMVYTNQSDRIRSLGAEGELRYEPGAGAMLLLSLTRQQVVALTPQGTTPFLNAPDTVVKAIALWPLLGPALRLGSSVVFDSGRHFRQTDPSATPGDDRVDDAMLWDVTLSGERRASHLRYVIGVYNVLDVRVARTGYPTGIDYTPALVPRYGREVRAGAAWTF